MLQLDYQRFYARPFLKWAGGKSKLISQYIPYFPAKFDNYYEPFLGGGAVFFYLVGAHCCTDVQGKNRSILTDINPELINAYCCVRDSVEDLILLLAEHQSRHSKDYYYQIRKKNIGTPSWKISGEAEPHPDFSAIELAARLIYLNKTCFNGLYRENSKGEFNVPIGKYKNPTICNPDGLRSVSVALRSASIKVSSFDAVLNYASSQDFVYFDPPYYPLSPTSNFTAYSSYSFNENDQIRLKDTFAQLAKRGVKVMLSNSDCGFIRELYKEFNIHEILAARAINSNAKKRGKISELLITSY